MQPIIYSISQLTAYLRELLETDDVLQDVWVKGEISNLSRPGSGHLYFTLKDSSASMRCVMWKAHSLRLNFSPRDGMAVEAHGSMNIYEVGGQVQLYIDTMRPAGEGALYQEFMRLKAKLEAEGLFDEAHKRPIPDFPKVIGVVTSASGAALQDILNTLSRRLPLAKVYLASTQVQGVDAPAGIIKAIEQLNVLVAPDVILVARGGGSIEDLWAFNDEQVARAIYNSQAPVISGVGHETDFTIADFVADLRAPTPTGSAELATQISIADLATALRDSKQLLASVMEEKLAENALSLERLNESLVRLSPTMKIFNYRQRLDELAARVERALQNLQNSNRLRLASLNSRLESLNPTAVLKRGYAIVTREVDGRVISQRNQVRPGENVNIQVSDGTLPATINER